MSLKMWLLQIKNTHCFSKMCIQLFTIQTHTGYPHEFSQWDPVMCTKIWVVNEKKLLNRLAASKSNEIRIVWV